MTTVMETLLSFVNRWECDENDHLNVQFYAAKFEEANRQFFSLLGPSGSLLGKRLVRQIRFHRESTIGMLLEVTSSLTFDGFHAASIVHEMTELDSGMPISTVIDGYAPTSDNLRTIQPQFAEFVTAPNKELMPKGPSNSNMEHTIELQDILDRGAYFVHRNTVLQRYCGVDDMADDFFVVGCFSDGSAHVWERTGLTRKWLEANDCGRIALEIKLSYGSGLTVGDTIIIVSGITSVGRKTFGFRHHVIDIAKGEIVLTGDIVAAILNLTSRTAVPIPESIVENLNAMKIT